MSLFITFEGIEGCGKTTQANILVERFQKEGFKVLALREPGGTDLGEKLRYLTRSCDLVPEAELLIMNAARAQLVAEHIRPALELGKMVVCDRFFDSTTAYQGFGREIPLEHVSYISQFAIGETIPHATFYLRVPAFIGKDRDEIRRAANNEPDRIGRENREFFLRVERGYEALAESCPRFVTIDGTRGPNQVAGDIWSALRERFPDWSPLTGAPTF